MASQKDHIKWFRDSSPYIDAHIGKTFVVYIGGEALRSSNLANIISDVALLNVLGIKLVLVYGAEPQIQHDLTEMGLNWETAGGVRITTAEAIGPIAATLGAIRTSLEAGLSTGILNSPTKSSGVQVASGNYIKAAPLGIIDGTDFHLTGKVRKVNSDLIRSHLETGAVVLVAPLGYSPSGETFSLDALALARDIACAMQSDKLIYMTDSDGLPDQSGNTVNEIDLSDFDDKRLKLDAHTGQLLDHAIEACARQVSRCHVISHHIDGAILEELFTRDGCGTQIVGHSYEQVRVATSEDVAGILKLIEPLEEAGILVRRSRELLESEIGSFVVVDRDGLLISCAALYTYDDAGELACLVTHPDYRNGDRGEKLLDAIEKKATAESIDRLFVLTTQSAHWFLERGFCESSVDSLPVEKKALYNYQRGSKVLIKQLQAHQ